MKYQKIGVALIMGIILANLSSCKKFLEEPTPQIDLPIDVIGEGTAGLDAAINGGWAYWTFNAAAAGNTTIYPEVMSDYVVASGAQGGRIFNAYTRNFAVDGYDLIGEITQRSSKAENLANLVIQIANETPPKDLAWAKNGNRVKGEAYFLRGWVHWEYILMMADSWNAKNVAANATARGPLLRFTPILSLDDLPQARTPLAAAYDSVINDLKIAEALLPTHYDATIHDVSFSARANKFAAAALLAKVYFQKSDFANALIYANKAIGSTIGATTFPLTANPIDLYTRMGITGTTNKATKGEVLLEYVAASKISTRSGQQLNSAWTRTPTIGYYFGNYFKTLVGFNTTLDKRYLQLINPTFNQTFNSINHTGWATKKFPLDANLVYIRSAEILLMRAEINARAGQLADALKDLNLVKQRAGLPAALITEFATAKALINDIIRERARELHAEGYRGHEIKRLGSLTDGDPDEVKFFKGDRSPLRDCGLNGLGCEDVKWNDSRLQFLIPPGETLVNPLGTN
ncbi:MAG: RagB/SusD family nutrient uptake outer membrane protein [Pyrinomonadaceae bacterium]|nr:RagB/SusD family nutrient uptake outer membrane protein [Sphingobacteriaceae bacterium]